MPGVDIQYRRRKTHSRRSHEDNSHFHGHGNNDYPSSPHGSWNEPSMDEAALKARQRLEEKLGCFRPSRLNGVQANEGRANQTTTTTTRDSDDNQYSISRILGRRPWHFQSINSSASSSNSKSKGGQPMICVVCLEDCRAEGQQVMMELPCSHRFHSKCLLPWLASHPNCPSCRSPVQI